jgi:hypothetical protein
MFPAKFSRWSARAGQRGSQIGLLISLLFVALAIPQAFAQHVVNPFAGATQYVNPDYATEVNAVVGQTSNATLANQMKVVATYPTAVWMDHMAAITGDGGRLSLAQHINTALSQQSGTTELHPGRRAVQGGRGGDPGWLQHHRWIHQQYGELRPDERAVHDGDPADRW